METGQKLLPGPGGGKQSTRFWPKTTIHGAPAVLWLPALSVVVLMLLPILYLVFRTYQGGIELVDLLFRDRTLTLLKNTVVLTVVVTTASIAVAVPLAWLIGRTDLPGRKIWSVVTVLPLAIPSYVGAFTVIALLGPRGILQGWLEPLGVQRLPEIYGLTGASVTLTLLIYPYVLITVRAALHGVDRSYEESARAMGYGPWKTFFLVNIPLLRPAIAAGGLLVALYTISEFGAVSLLRYDTFTRAIYTQYANAFDRTLAAGLALLLVGLTLIVLGLEWKTRGRATYFRSFAGPGRPPARMKLGRWKPVALLYCTVITCLSLVIPIGVICYWLWRGVRAGEPLRLVWEAAWNSFYVAGLASVAAVCAAAPLALFAVRYPGTVSVLFEKLSYTGYALPGIVIGLAMVFFGANYAPWIYQTLALLIVAYVILFLAQAIGALHASLLQINPRIEEAGRVLGYSSVRIWATVTVPLIRRGVLAGGALVFLTVIKELPATLLLQPIGFETLATRIWSASAEGFWARAAAPALLLIIISALAMVFLNLRDSYSERDE